MGGDGLMKIPRYNGREYGVQSGSTNKKKYSQGDEKIKNFNEARRCIFKNLLSKIFPCFKCENWRCIDPS